MTTSQRSGFTRSRLLSARYVIFGEDTRKRPHTYGCLVDGGLIADFVCQRLLDADEFLNGECAPATTREVVSTEGTRESTPSTNATERRGVGDGPAS